MTKRKQSSVSPGRSKKQSSKVSLGELIIRGYEEGIAYFEGKGEARVRTIEIPDRIDVKKIRERTGLSQSEFAGCFGFSLRTLQEWEQGRTRPDSAVRAYLIVIDRNPKAVQTALAS